MEPEPDRSQNCVIYLAPAPAKKGGSGSETLLESIAETQVCVTSPGQDGVTLHTD